LEVNSRIDSVIVYNDRVMVARVATVYLEKGATLIFPDLPGGIDDASVKIKAKGMRIGEVQVLKGYTKEPPAVIKELEGKIKSLEIEDRNLSDELLVLKDKEKYLQSIAVGAPDVISKELYSGRVSPDAWRQGLAFMTEELLKSKRRSAEIERLRVDLKEKADALKAELADRKSYFENKKQVVLEAQVSSAQNYELELAYVLWGASWRTYYEVRANPSDGKVDLTYFGKIFQRTGEDWENVRVVLSTAQPAYGGSAPSPSPWYISIYSPEAEEYKDDYGAGRAMAKEKAPAKPMEVSAITIPAAPPVETGIAIWYPLPGRYTIKSGDPEKKVPIVGHIFDAEFRYFTVPRMELLAYLTGSLSNSTDYLYLAGDGSTYVGDDFTGKIYFPNIAPDESLTASFGVDDRVKVKRELKKSKISKGGLFKNITRYELVYENTVKNFHDKEIDCMLVDQVPLPQNAEIKVSVAKLDPKPDIEDKDRGIYTWKTVIKPGAEYKVTVSFIVDTPENVTVENLLY
jgi:uncharacterized protein (TIGR02231 family)